MDLFVVCEVGTLGKRAARVFAEESMADSFIGDKNPHLFKREMCPAPNGYAPPMELFAAHVLDAEYNIHRFSRLCLTHDDASRVAGDGGLVLMLVPG